MSGSNITRREAARLLGGTAVALALSARPVWGAMEESRELLTRAIPSSGEKIPVIGLGTWQTFDVGESAAELQPLEEVLTLFVKLGGTVIDSSPMYGKAEQVIGLLATKLGLQKSLFLATKVWTTGKQAGVDSMTRSLDRLRTGKIELMQVHNLVDVTTHLATLRGWKAEGKIRYIGITHYNSNAYTETEKVLRSETVDFLQINYSLGEREAEERILPLAQERGVAVIVNRPFGGGNLFARVRTKPLPDFAAELNCSSWAQLMLKWIVAHPAVACAIPATSKVDHLRDNMRGGVGPLPDAKTRKRLVDAIAGM